MLLSHLIYMYIYSFCFADFSNKYIFILITDDPYIFSNIAECMRVPAEYIAVVLIQMDSDVFTELSERANTLSEDPLQRALIFLNLFAEMVIGMTGTHPGCLAAAFIYETQQFDDSIRTRVYEGMAEWREIIASRLEEILEVT